MQKINSTNSPAQNTRSVKPRQQHQGQPGSIEQQGNNISVKEHQETTQALASNSSQQKLNNAILQANLSTSMAAGNEPMTLLYKAAVEGVNEVLASQGLGENSIQQGYEEGLDVSPNATADRIVSMSTAFFARYASQHSEMGLDQAVKSFAEIISSGIDKGFAEAKDILDGLGVLQGDIAANINSTYDLVQQGLKAFVENYKQGEKS